MPIKYSTTAAMTRAVSALALSISWTAQAHAGDPAAAQCNALASADFSGIQEAPAQVIEAKLIVSAADLPAFCEVRGYVMPNVGFKLQLPVSNWNKKFFETGCGGSCGSVDNTGCDNAVRKGYACIASDMGHRSGGLDGLWAYDNLQAQVDYGYRGVHVAAVVGKAITERYYDAPPQRAYFSGCSTGGRQGLVGAQRFPWDFDGIIAGAPWIDDTASTMEMVWAIRALKGSDGLSLLNHADLKLVHEAVLAKCDRDDGLEDGIVGNPLGCDFNPADLACKGGKNTGCLSKAQVEAIQKVYSGPTDSKGEKTFVSGATPGSELAWENVLVYTTASALAQSPWGKSPWEMWATEYFRYMVMPALGLGWQIADFDFDRDYKRIGAVSGPLLSATNPDLRQFKRAGGKLIIYQGWNDPLGAIAEKTIDYYQTVERVTGSPAATREFARLYMVPGMDHCGGGNGAFHIDYLSYLESWVERGEAPDTLIGAHPKSKNYADWGKFPIDPAQIAFTRPIYPYPLQAKYRGMGAPNIAESFKPMAPRRQH